MKTLNNYSAKKQTFLLLMAIMILFLLPVNAQKRSKTDYLSLKKLPAGLTLQEKNPYSYKVITDYFNHDILGNLQGKMEVKGIYTRGLENGKMRWNDVTFSNAGGPDQSFPEGTKQSYMENFTYDKSDDLMKEALYKDFPSMTGAFGKNLVWDVVTFEVFAWTYYDSLQLNIPFTAHKINRSIELEGLGNFENKDIKLTWTGISSMNGKICAVIEFLAMDNPLKFNTSFMEMKGRSHYWGTVWLSLSDKQIEHGVLYEDVNMEMKLNGQEKSQLVNTTRKIDFIKILN